MKKCSIINCGDKHSSRGYCNKHYQRLLKHGDAEARVRPVRIDKVACSVDNCDKLIRSSNGLCNQHYMKWYRHGDPLFKQPPGVWNTSTYKIWTSMKQRCNNSKSQHYKSYGGRGITYDPKWEQFKNFLEDMGWRPDGLSLDRKNNDGNYTKGNCRWVDNLVQQNNTRANIMIQYSGEIRTLAEWNRKSDLPPNTIGWRIKRGWSVKDAIETPLRIYKNTRSVI